jgi:pimeloyl-ACP methyl ester carboxylesterase
MTARTRLAPLLAAAALLAAGCGSHRPATPAVHTQAARATPPAAEITAQPTAAPTPRPAELDSPHLAAVHDCPSMRGATCMTLRVPLDHTGRTSGSLDLQVASLGDDRAPVLVFLSGGPGQPGLPFLPKLHTHLGAVAAQWRLVVLDQRGTGAGALRCPALQRQMGASDLTPPTAAAVRACGERIGARRRFFTTADTVADLEDLRVALGASRLALDGVSYGTYVAERYSLAHPQRVNRLVLDSVVPHDGVDLLSTVPLQATARVLRAACKPCASDPAADLAAVVRRRHDGPQLLDTLTGLSVGPPQLRAATLALRRARAGDDAPLNGLVRGVQRVDASYTAPFLSQGLHASSLCADSPAPWGGAAAPLAGRREALAAAVAKLSPRDVYPYDRATAAGNGIALQCLYWPPTAVPAPAPARDLPAVPVLLLGGDQDLSTPLEWTRAEAARAPRGQLVVARGAGHSVQSQDIPSVKRALARFLGG